MSYYERHLPHWQPDDAALFITWRLYGSLPARHEVLKQDSPGKAFAAWDKSLHQAATGPRWLMDSQVAQAVIDTLDYGQNELKLYNLHAWVVMVNHVHILIYPHAPLAWITRSIKNFSAKKANAILNRSGPFWADESFDRWVRSAKEFHKIDFYIEQNPVSAALVQDPADWPYSSAHR